MKATQFELSVSFIETANRSIEHFGCDQIIQVSFLYVGVHQK